MIIWEILNNYKEYKEIVCSTEKDWIKLLDYGFDGHSIKSEWSEVEVDIQENSAKLGDILGLGADFLVVNNRALKIILDIAKESVEVLPLKCNRMDLYIINILDVVDCLNIQKSKFKLYKACDEIQSIEEYELDKKKIGDSVLFKIDKIISGHMYATDYFKEMLEKENIQGLKFVKVWSD